MSQDSVTSKTGRAGLAKLAGVILCAGASVCLYRAMVLVIPRMTSAEPTSAGEIFPWVKAISHDTLDSIQHKTHGLGYTFEFMACCAGLFALYAIVLRLAKGIQPRWFVPLAAGASAVFMGLLICTPVMLSSDVYSYAHYGYLLADKGLDAHSTAAVAVAGTNIEDPFSLGGYFDFVASVYGPLWTVISAGLVLAGGSHIGLTVLLFRALGAAAALGSGGLIWTILKQLAPERAALGTLLFLWNPLVVIESALSGHNDTCMMLLALLAVWLHLRGSKTGAVIALALSALIKVITWPLVPLYMLMMLRRTAGWRHGAWFVGRASIGVAAAVALSMFVARMNPDGLTAHTAGSAQFYENNYHEVLFKVVRHLLGEPADSLEAPMDFKTWWVAIFGHAVLHEGTSNKTKDLVRLEDGHPLLVISDEDSDEWLRVYDPADHIQGYVDWPHLTVIAEPPNAEKDPTVKRLSGWPPDWPTVVEANRLIRLVTWSLFVAFGLLAAWKTADFDDFVIWGTAFFLASQLLVFTKIWPWYAVWPLAYGALKPGSLATRLAVMLSAGMLLLYALLDYCNTQWNWVNDYRSIPTIVIPTALFALLLLWRQTSWSKPRT